MNSNEGRVYFAFEGDNFNPDEITKYLGIEPTSVKRKGTVVVETVPKNNTWQLSTENIVNEYIDVFEMSTEIVNKLKHKKELILEVKQRFNVTTKFVVLLWISINNKHSTPAIGFHQETVEFLGEIGAFIDIDTYKH